MNQPHFAFEFRLGTHMLELPERAIPFASAAIIVTLFLIAVTMSPNPIVTAPKTHRELGPMFIDQLRSMFISEITGDVSQVRKFRTLFLYGGILGRGDLDRAGAAEGDRNGRHFHGDHVRSGSLILSFGRF